MENQELHIEKIPDYQLPLDDDELNKEYTWDDSTESDDGDADYYVENESCPEENVDSKLTSNFGSDNWSIYGMQAIWFTIVKCMKKSTSKRVTFLVKMSLFLKCFYAFC